MSAFADFQTERPFARATAVEVNRSSTRKILTGGLGSITGVHAATRIVAETGRQLARAEVPRPVNLDWSDAVGSTWSRACWHGKRAEVRRVIERVAGANRAPVAFPRRVATG